MDMIPRNNYGERCQFDAYCKLVLYHEATAKQAWQLVGDDTRAGLKILAH